MAMREECNEDVSGGRLVRCKMYYIVKVCENYVKKGEKNEENIDYIKAVWVYIGYKHKWMHWTREIAIKIYGRNKVKQELYF